MNDKSHVRRIGALVVIGLLLAFGVQRLLLPASFGDAGRFRLDGLFEIMAKEPVHQGRKACGSCHQEILALHEKDIHFGVMCEDCHGPGNLHVAYHRSDEKAGLDAQAATMPREYTLEGCLFCHRKLAARPADFPQVDPIEHYRFLHVVDEQTRCIECHSPHEPLFLLTEVASARIHPVIRECDTCHQPVPEKDHRQVPDHPVLFTCNDCHKALVADFEQHNHASIRCTACHLFHKENEMAGRIFKNGNQRFCLLCHEKKAFKGPGGPPRIVKAEHLKEQADLSEEDEMYKDPRLCLECHLDNIHDSSNY